MSADGKKAEVDALQAALAGVHAALWGYAVAAPRFDAEADEVAVSDAYTACRALRDELTTFLTAKGATPVAAEPAYALPFPVQDAEAASRLAIHLENGCASLLGAVVSGAATAAIRTFAANALTASVRRRARFGGQPVAFPGLLTRTR